MDINSLWSKKEFPKAHSKKLKDLFDISKKLFLTLKNLIGILSSNSLSNHFFEAIMTEEKELEHGNQLIRPVQPKQKINSKSFELAHEDEWNDTALSSFSP